MIDTIREYAGELVVLRCWCGIQYAVPRSLREAQLRMHNDLRGDVVSIYCPLGHAAVPSHEPDAKRLRRQLEEKKREHYQEIQRERAAHDQTRADRDHKENQRRAEKAAKTKIKKRVQGGACPCCNRTFQNLARHMKGQHPDYMGVE